MSRRWLVVIAMTIISLGLTFGPASAATAVDVSSPVDPVPDLPSRTVKMAPTASWNEGKVVEMWRAILHESVKPGNTVATVPKPITPAVQLARGSTGGVLTQAFFGGFAIGTAGLLTYGAITGDDPLANVCGTGLELAAEVLYVGMVPDCTVFIPDPNIDVPEGLTDLTMGAYLVSYKGSVPLSGVDRWCYTMSGSVPSGHALVATNTAGSWVTVGPSTATYCNPIGGTHALARSQFPTPVLGLRSTTTNQIVTQMEQRASDPLRTPRCSIDWEDGTTTTGVGTPYRETEGFAPSPTRTGCKTAWDAKPGAGPSLLPSRIGVESETEDGAITQIVDQEVPDMSPGERRALAPTSTKGLQLHKVVNNAVQSCMTWEADCVNWWTATQSGTQGTTQDGSEYRCSFDGEPVTLAECGVYRHTFDTQTSNPTITDPQTGTSQPWSAQPNPGNSLNPGTSIGSQPGTPGAQCMSSYPSLANPIDWVLHPVKCALVWAFVPRASEVDSFHGNVQARFNSSAIGSTVASVAGFTAIFSVAEGCGGLPFEMDLPGGIHIETQLFEACTEPMAGVAATVKSVLTFAIIGGAALAVIRYFSGLFAFNPLGITDPNEGARGGVSFK